MLGYNTSLRANREWMFAWRSFLLGRRPTPHEIALLSKEKNGQDRYWPATLHLNCFSVAEAPAGSNWISLLPPFLQIDSEAEHHATIHIDDHGQRRSLDRLPMLLIDHNHVHGRMVNLGDG